MPLNEPPKLGPKAKEVWAGIRSVSSMSSGLQTLVNDLRAVLSGFEAYAAEVAAASSFDNLEPRLEADYLNVEGYDEIDVEATVALLDDEFFWSNYESGVAGVSTYDGYRGWLTNNGLATVDADRHIQLLKAWYDASYTVHTDRSEITTYDEWETYAADAGMASGRAASLREKTADQYADFDAFDSDALQSSDPLAELLNTAPHSPDLSSGDGLGVKIWESTGTTPSGVSAAPGDVSIRSAGRIHLETPNTDADEPDAGTADLSYGPTGVGNDLLDPGQSTTVSATIDNTGSASATVSVTLSVNARAEQTTAVEIPAGESRTPSFDFHTEGRDYGEYEVVVGRGDSATIVISPPGVALS